MMENLINKHAGKICIFFATIFAIEFGIWCHQMPKEFQHNVIPRIDKYLNISQGMETDISILEKRINLLMGVEKHKIIGGDYEKRR
jgi:hypothetical protein